MRTISQEYSNAVLDYAREWRNCVNVSAQEVEIPHLILNDGVAVDFNQLLENGNFESSEGWSGVNATLMVADNIATLTPTGTNPALETSIDYIAGHQYLFCLSAKRSTDGEIVINNNNGLDSIVGELTAGTWVTFKITTTAENTGTYSCQFIATNEDTECEFKNIYVVDLTKMFDNVPDLSELRNIFIDDYYPYAESVKFEQYSSAEISVTEIMSDTDSLSMGKAFSSEAKIKLIEPLNTVDYTNCVFKVETNLKVGDNYERVNMGVYFPSVIDRDDDYESINITAYDKMSKLQKKYVPKRTINNIEDLLADIVAQYNLVSNVTITFPYSVELVDGTVAEQLGWVAGLEGKNAVFNSEGELEFRWYKNISPAFKNRWKDFDYAHSHTLIKWQHFNGETWSEYNEAISSIGRSQQKEGTLKIKEKWCVIYSLTGGYGAKQYTYGHGQGLVFENPYVYSADIHQRGERLVNTRYSVGEVSMFGNPMYEVGDIARVVDKDGNTYKFFISSIEWNLKGGCSAVLYSVGLSDTEVVINDNDISSVTQTQNTTDTQKAVERVSNLFNAGYFVIIENNGVPSGWEAKDNFGIGDNTVKCTVLNSGNGTIEVVTPTSDKTYCIYTKGKNNYAESGSWQTGSARALKDNITPFIESAVDKINEIEVVNYTYKDDNMHRVGFVADDTDEIFATPEHNAMDYSNCIGMLLKAIQELSTEIETLKEGLS